MDRTKLRNLAAVVSVAANSITAGIDLGGYEVFAWIPPLLIGVGVFSFLYAVYISVSIAREALPQVSATSPILTPSAKKAPSYLRRNSRKAVLSSLMVIGVVSIPTAYVVWQVLNPRFSDSQALLWAPPPTTAPFSQSLNLDNEGRLVLAVAAADFAIMVLAASPIVADSNAKPETEISIGHRSFRLGKENPYVHFGPNIGMVVEKARFEFRPTNSQVQHDITIEQKVFRVRLAAINHNIDDLGTREYVFSIAEQ